MTLEELIQILQEELPNREFSVGYIGNSRMGNVYRCRFKLEGEGARTLFARNVDDLYEDIKIALEYVPLPHPDWTGVNL